jgi:PAS domain S-box-containing protein
MRTPVAQNFIPLQVANDSAILSVLSLPALVFEFSTLRVIESNGYFHQENDMPFIELLTKYDYAFLNGSDIQQMLQCLTSGKNYTVNKISDEHNEISTYEVNVALLPDHQSAFLYINLLSRHVSDPNSEQKIKEQSDFLKELISSIREGIGLINEDNNITFCNQSFGKIFGISELNLVGENFLNIIGYDNRLKAEKELNNRQKSEGSFELKVMVGNLEKTIEIYANPRFNQSAYIGSFLTLIDITDHVQMEQDLIKARDKAQEADHLKTTFLTNMSHEIRTPMNSILGFSSMLQLKGISRQKRDQYLDIIISRGKHLMEIINDILDITKLDEDQVQITPVQCNLNDIVRELYRTFDNNLRKSKKPVKLIMHSYLPDERSSILTDGFHLQQIIANLLNNSEKFTEEGFIEFGYLIENEDTLLFYIRDTGIGVTSELQEVIFERFRQADNSFTRIYGGMGLGLSICKGLVTLMGGRIWLESDGKSGSTFYFTVPYHSFYNDTETLDEKPVDDTTKWAKKNILIVEDDPSSYEYLNEVLSSAGCTVLHAANGHNALKLFNESKSIDLILLDIQLPETNGYEIAQSIRKTNKAIPIIAQTAHALPEDRKKCLESGCNDYITKPIQYNMLINMLKTYLS